MVCDKMVSFGLVGTMVGLLSFNRICERARWLLVGKELMSQHEWKTIPYTNDWKRYSYLDLGLDEDGKGANEI
tara:strand:+ start:423 stop:641 length:219 start_codon:yes stop_codon:yes gene_type:complete